MKLRDLIDWRWWLNLEPPLGPAPTKSLTITITAHNEGKWVAETIESVFRQTYNAICPIQVIVVDDGSTDNTQDVLAPYRDRIRVVTHEVASGRKAYASNAGLEITDTELFLALDADAILKDDAIEQAMKRFSDPKVRMVAGSIQARYSETLWEKARLAEYLYAFSAIKPAQDRVMGVLIASGCFSMVYTEDLKSLGGYSGRTIGEDFDLTLTYHEKGWRVRFAHDAVCVVVDPHTREDFTNQVTRWSHGFIQNLQVRDWNLFAHSKRLGLMVWFYLLWTIVGPFFLPLVLFAVSSNPLWAVAWFFTTWGVIVWLPITFKAIQSRVPLSLVAKTILPMFVAQFVNAWLFLRALFDILVLRQAETGWRRGHA